MRSRKELAPLKKLTSLQLNQTRVTHVDQGHSPPHNLTHLAPTAKVTDAGLKDLTGLRKPHFTLPGLHICDRRGGEATPKRSTEMRHSQVT